MTVSIPELTRICEYLNMDQATLNEVKTRLVKELDTIWMVNSMSYDHGLYLAQDHLLNRGISQHTEFGKQLTIEVFKESKYA
jgi:hypothetical protein